MHDQRDNNVWRYHTFFGIGLLSTDNLVAFGDSIIVGNCGSACSFYDTSVRNLIAANSSRTIVSRNLAATGEQSSVSYAKALVQIPALKPLFAVWTVWSPNDGWANVQSAYDTYVAAFISLAHANGTIPVILTAIPCGGVACGGIPTVSQDNVRKSVNTAALALAASDVIVVDESAVMNDGGSPQQIQTGNTSDAVHPNATGAALMVTPLQSALQTYLTAHP